MIKISLGLLSLHMVLAVSCFRYDGPTIIPIPVLMTEDASGDKFTDGEIVTTILLGDDVDAELGDEGYQLRISKDQIVIEANHPAGIFYGRQTIRLALLRGGIPTGLIRDYPRFAWRGAMLDIARHFFDDEEIKRYINLLALYKINRLHLHLSDDQGWRIEIKSWPNLALLGGLTHVAGGKGGYLTQAQYAQIVSYAQERFITIVPEIDMPGHMNAALVAYPELNCNGIAPEPFTGVGGGFSSLCLTNPLTQGFVDDVIREIAEITPGEYIHVGGDEAFTVPAEPYRTFIQGVQAVVEGYGKTMIGWEEILAVPLGSNSIGQNWKGDIVPHPENANTRRIVSNDRYAYMNYTYTFLDSITAYDWDPDSFAHPATIMGVEAPLWTETVETMADVEFMTFPRIMGYAEIGWSPASKRDWKNYVHRAAAQAPLLKSLGVNFYKDPEIPWTE